MTNITFDYLFIKATYRCLYVSHTLAELTGAVIYPHARRVVAVTMRGYLKNTKEIVSSFEKK